MFNRETKTGHAHKASQVLHYEISKTLFLCSNFVLGIEDIKRFVGREGQQHKCWR